MADVKLPLKLLVNLDGVFQSAKFSSPDVFSYLGKDLGKWIENLLGEFGVGDEPVIKGKSTRARGFMERSLSPRVPSSSRQPTSRGLVSSGRTRK